MEIAKVTYYHNGYKYFINEDDFDSCDWAYTLKISAGAKAFIQHLDYDGDIDDYPQNKNILRYRDLSTINQEDMIEDTLKVIPLKYHVTCFYELHADGRTHAHGTVYGASKANMEYFRQAINRVLGYKLDNPNMFYFKKIKDYVGWNAYCKKHQKILEEEEDEEDDLLPDKAYNTNVFKTKDPNSQ